MTTEYYLNGSTILTQITGNDRLDFLYDDTGSLLGLKWNGQSYYYVKNLQGDIIGILDSDGKQVVEYVYETWGQFAVSYGSMAATLGEFNPFRYRGYYYDTESGLYYLNSRYYDSEIGRFLNADRVISGSGKSIHGLNLFIYCLSNPVNLIDNTGYLPQALFDAATAGLSIAKAAIEKSASSHDVNRRPNSGEPGSTWEAPNGDKRTYGPDGRPQHDYDHDDHGFPDKHPHDENGGHNHDWDWSKTPPRGDPYAFNWEPVIGVALVAVCVVGIIIVAADDATGIGVADDFLFGPLGTGVGEGLILIFG